MLKESVGKIIEVKITKKYILICFDCFEELKINEQTYSSNFLYANKEITFEDYLKLKEEDEFNKELQKCINLLSNKQYSEYEIIKKLKSKKIESKTIDQIILKLKELDLINDVRYVEDILFIYNRSNMGKYKIIQNLKEKKIESSIINNLVFDQEEELIKAKEYLNSITKKYKDKSNNKLVQMIINSLFNNGFEKEIIDKVICDINKHSINEEKENLKREIIRLKVYNYDEEKIIHKLMLKGYEYKLIKQALEEE